MNTLHLHHLGLLHIALTVFLMVTLLLPAAPVSTTFTYDAANRLTAASSNGYTPDKAGNLTAISGPTAAAEIALQQQTSLDLTDGTSSLDFGAVSVGSSSLQAVIFIQNGGNANLDDLTVTKDGAHSADFTIGSVGLPTSLVPGASAFITMTFTPSAAGARSAALHVTSNDANENPFDLTLTGTGQSLLTAQETWRQTHFGTSANAGSSADSADPDHDGIPNLAEFAYGWDPNQNSAGMLPQPQRSGGMLSISFTKPSGVSGIIYGAESSTSLLPGDWTPISNTGVFPIFQFSVPVGNQPSLFMRLKVTPATPPPPP